MLWKETNGGDRTLENCFSQQTVNRGSVAEAEVALSVKRCQRHRLLKQVASDIPHSLRDIFRQTLICPIDFVQT